MVILLRQAILAIAIATLMAYRGYKRKSLTTNGAVAAWIVGFLSITLGMRGFLLLLFYIVGTKATKYKSKIKKQLDISAEDSSCRGPSQVLACSIVGLGLQLIHYVYCGDECSITFIDDDSQFASSLACAIIAHHATNLADTLSSELGILSKTDPILITNGRKVPRGTNGGVSKTGLICSVLGGFIIGVGTLPIDTLNGFDVQSVPIILFAILCGALGSIIDSILGATLQITYFDEDKKVVSDTPNNAVRIAGMDVLSNTQVNFVSVLITSALGFIGGPLFFRQQSSADVPLLLLLIL